ncbi:MAG: PAS domain S-box protein [Candidatus Omnitrophica bacterium]|nr:PAS domain S-box protein [Candidatus Omnitrophota bacterium]
MKMEHPELLDNNSQGEISEVTEHKKEEEKFKQYYQFMVESAHGAIFFKNLQSQFIIANNKTLEVFGLSREQVIGKNDYEISSDKKQARKNIEDDQFIFKTGKPREGTKHMIGVDGKRYWFHTIKFPQFDDKGNIIGLVGIVRDITERKKSESGHTKIVEAEKKKAEELKKAYAELQQSKDELVRSEKLAYTGRIAASIAHEIRNPLTNVVMSIRQLRKVIKPENPKTKHIEIVERNTERINYLIAELLNCARPPKLNIRYYDIRKVLENVLDSTKTKIKSQRIKVVKKFTSKSSKIMIDKELIGRALLNIVLNAIEAMSKRGKLTVITELNRDLFVIKVQDTGKGIPETDIIRIFDPFFSSKSGGVGLGLTLCYGIIVSHGGTVEVESKPRKGTIFTVSLPVGQNGGG